MTLPNSAKAHEMYEDIHHPIIEVDVTCENKNCRSNEKMAVAWCFSCAFSYNNNRPMRLCNQCNKIRHSIYIRAVSSYQLLSALNNWFKLVSGQFEQSNMHRTFDFCPRPARTQWISLLYRRLQKIEQIEPDHCDRYQNNHIKKCN